MAAGRPRTPRRQLTPRHAGRWLAGGLVQPRTCRHAGACPGAGGHGPGLRVRRLRGAPAPPDRAGAGAVCSGGRGSCRQPGERRGRAPPAGPTVLTPEQPPVHPGAAATDARACAVSGTPPSSPGLAPRALQADIDVSVERAACLVLLGDPDQALSVLGLDSQQTGGGAADAAVRDYILVRTLAAATCAAPPAILCAAVRAVGVGGWVGGCMCLGGGGVSTPASINAALQPVQQLHRKPGMPSLLTLYTTWRRAGPLPGPRRPAAWPGGPDRGLAARRGAGQLQAWAGDAGARRASCRP